MMLQRVVFWGLLFGIQYAGVAAQTAIWKTPTKADLKANTQDSVWLDWSSTYPAPFLRMQCKSDGGSLVVVSSFQVDTNGPFEYIMDSFLEPNKMKMPLSCQPELAKDKEGTNAVVCPVGIVWSYDASLAMKTVSQAQAVAPVTTGAAVSKPSTASPSSTPTPTSDPPSPTGTVTTGSPSQATVPPSSTEQSTEISTEKSTEQSREQSTADSSSGSTTIPTSSTDQSSTSTASSDQPSSSSTTGSAQPTTPSTAGSESDSKNGSGATTAPVASTSSSSNNTGAIVGGVVGGIAVISFIILGILFLRRQKRNRTSFTAVTNESSIWNFYFFNGHKKRIPKEDAAPVYEKDGSGMAREMEANTAGGKAVPYDPVELPVGSNYYR